MTLHHEAHSVSAVGVAGPSVHARGGIFRLLDRYRRYREYRGAETALARLSDEELDDIGVRRCDIHSRVWGIHTRR